MVMFARSCSRSAIFVSLTVRLEERVGSAGAVFSS